MFDMDPPDPLPSPSNQASFDPMRHTFSEEELKPQPMIKKARKIQVPDNMKVSVLAREGSVCVCRLAYLHVKRSRATLAPGRGDSSDANVSELHQLLSRRSYELV